MSSVLRRGHKKGVAKRRNFMQFFASSWKLGAQCYCGFHPYVSMLIYCIQRIGKSWAHLVHIIHCWKKVLTKLQKIIQTKIQQNDKMCKDKWNGWKLDCKKLFNNYKGIGHHASYMDLILIERDTYSSNNVITIETFQVERIISKKKLFD